MRLIETPELLHAQAEDMHGVEMIRNGLHDLAAECLALGIPALAIGARRGRDDRIGLLLQLLLQPRILECARAGAALQGVSPEKGPR
ncbi:MULTISPECIES: hypothetical protein [unclassified Bradyrhizobium]|uniref:hypothetical protein n=1 Tax=Bradyrhizobium sp. WBOS07 TaxID=2171499 RepID=UPI00211DAF01|nr:MULTISPECIES: hypothetical protein [unclassified Bradyrhizobium]